MNRRMEERKRTAAAPRTIVFLTLAFATASVCGQSENGQPTKIAYASDVDGNLEIYTMAPDGSGIARLTRVPGKDAEPKWSPDGKKIAFKTTRDGNDEIYVMNADGSNPVSVTRHLATDEDCSWSPDSKELCFASNRDGNFEIYRIQIDGTNIRRLTSNSQKDLSPSWSPDGKLVVFVSWREEPDGVYVMNSDGTGIRRLPTTGGNPSWSPDGKTIIFHHATDGNLDVWMIRADGGGMRRLTQHPASDGLGCFSPDGDRIAFVSTRAGKPGIYVMNSDATNAHQVSPKGQTAISPCWGPPPDGRPGATAETTKQAGVQSLIMVLRGGDGRQKYAAILALARMGTDALPAAEGLIELLSDGTQIEVQLSGGQTATTDSGWLVKGRGSLGGFSTIKEEALRALQKITAQEIGLDQVAWREWLQRVQDKGPSTDCVVLRSGQKILGRILNDGFTIKQRSTRIGRAEPNNPTSRQPLVIPGSGAVAIPRGDARIIESRRDETVTLKWSKWQIRSVTFDAKGPGMDVMVMASGTALVGGVEIDRLRVRLLSGEEVQIEGNDLKELIIASESRDLGTTGKEPATEPGVNGATPASVETGGDLNIQRLGMVVKTLTPDLAQRMGYDELEGVLVVKTEPGSLAGQAGIKKGSLIKEANRRPAKNPKEFNDIIEQAGQKGEKVLLLIKDGATARFVVLSLPKESVP